MIGPQKHIQGLTIKEFVFKYLKMFGLLMFVFYYIYPQALGVFGRSFILPAAVLGVGLYAWNRFPFAEVPRVIFVFLLLLFWCFFSEFMGNDSDTFRTTYLRSQMAWFFTAYLINFTIFNVHKNPKFEVLVGYIAAAIALQCVITFLMNQHEWANDFFYALQMQSGDIAGETKEIIEEQRLMGYGTALFGAGMVAGYGLIFLAYLISTLKLNTFQLLGMVVVFCFVFFIGLFSARTTTIGLGAAIGFMFVLYFVDKDSEKKQTLRFVGLSILMFSIGAGLATEYFPEFTEWAFEMFDNFQETGKFSTESSDTLYNLFYMPPTLREMLIGSGSFRFFGNDMGYTRIIHYIGLFGAFFYFGYQIFLGALSLTKDLSANLLIIMVVVYSMIMNIKGFTDMNPTLYLFLFFFLFHKYYRYYPMQYLRRKLEIIVKKKEELNEN